MNGLWLKWTWRDFRGRWIQVLATSLILAVGIGTFGGVVGLREWREKSTAASLQAMRQHDLRADLGEGTFVSAGRLTGALAGLPRGLVVASEERLIAAGQIDASHSGTSVLTPARLVGIPIRPGGQTVDRVAALSGRSLEVGDAHELRAVIDWNFARQYDLPAQGAVRLAGLGRVQYVGRGVTPQHVVVVGEAGISGGESGLGIVYLPLAAAQTAARAPDRVNELVLRFASGVDEGRARVLVERHLRAALPKLGMTFTAGNEEVAQRILYRDARNDQRVFLALAVLVLAGAGFAAFNLVTRVVESQRREIGVGMALGVEPRLLALRPLALGVQIAVLGVVLGIPVGLALSAWIKDMMGAFFPLPVFASTFPVELYAIGAVVGVAAPLLACSIPVRRAIGVQPVEAIRVGHRAASGAGAAAALRRVALPGSSLGQMPLRNLARSPRRTLMTVLGLGAVLAVVVAVLGMIDAISGTADRQSAELLRTSPGRVEVQLARPGSPTGPAVESLAHLPGVEMAEPSLTVGARAASHGARLPLALRFVDPASRVWHPTVTRGHLEQNGIVLAQKAVEDLGVDVGDTVALVHPVQAGHSMAMRTTPVRVAGIHGNPVRAYAYADERFAARLGLAGLATTVSLVPKTGAGTDSIERTLFGNPVVASVRPARADADALRTTVDQFSSAVGIVAFITLAMALLVAFTSTSVSLEERRREFATIFAFGFPTRSGLRIAVTESAITGVLGTIVGLALGIGITTWIVESLMPQVFPDLGATVSIAAGTLITTIVIGVVAVALAPLSTYRRMRGMDLPSTLRVME